MLQYYIITNYRPSIVLMTNTTTSIIKSKPFLSYYENLLS